MKRLFLLFACVAFISACTAKDSFIVNVKLDGVADGIKIELIPGATHKQEKLVAETVVKNGRFTFTYTIEEPRLFMVYAPEMKKMIRFVAEPGAKMTVKGTFQEPVVEGSKAHLKYVELYEKPRAEMEKVFVANRDKYSEISRKMSEARGAKDQKAIEEISKSEEWIAYGAAERDFFSMVGEKIKKIVYDNSDSWWGPFLLMCHTSYLTSENNEWYNQMSDAAKNSYYGKLVKEELFPEGIMGKAAPSFTAKDVDGKEYTLASLLKGNNYILIDFWASWCGPCRKSLPEMKELAKKYAGKGLVVVSISIDKDPNEWVKALEEEKMPWINLRDESDISTGYGVKTIPSVFLLDANGTVLFEKLYGKTISEQLVRILGE